MHRRRTLRVGGRRGLVLAALVALAGATLTLPTVTAADPPCSVATCRLDNNTDCVRASGNCPVCVQYVNIFIFFGAYYKCTDPASRTGACASGTTMCPAPTPAPTPRPSPKPAPVNTVKESVSKPAPAPAPAPAAVSASVTVSASASTPGAAPSPSPTTQPTTESDAPSTTSRTPGSDPSPSSTSSTTSSPIGVIRFANFSTSSDSADNADNEARAAPNELQRASVETPSPDETGVGSGDSGSSSSSGTWIFIVAGAMIALVAAVVLGKRYVARRHDDYRDDSEIGGGVGKDFGAVDDARRPTTATDFSESVLNLNATPATSTSAYVPIEHAAGTASGPTTGVASFSGASFGGAAVAASSHRTTSALGAADNTSGYFKSDAQWRQPASLHSYRGSQHINMSFVDDPLTASQLSMSPSRDLSTSELAASMPQATYESHDAFGESPADSEWMASGYFDADGGHNSGNTEFYSSKISEISGVADNDSLDDDGHHFTHRSSESPPQQSSAKWKQKFYVEL